MVLCLLNILFLCRNVLSLGASVPWPDQLEMMTGTRKLDASAMMEYFRPLYLLLVKANRERAVHVGWNSDYGKVILEEN